jgi:hypothetical protein
MKKRRETSGFARLLELNRVPVTPVKSFDRETLTQYNERMRREAEAEANAPILASIEQESAAVRQTQKVFAAYWSQTVAEIQKDCEKNAAAVDIFFEVPALRDSFTVEDLQASFASWFDNAMPKNAYTLTQNGEGGPRLFLFGLVVARRSGCDMSNPAAWQAAFDRLRELDSFQPGEVAFDSSKVQAEPEPVAAPVPLSERQQVVEDFYKETQPLHYAWLDSLYTNFNGFRPSKEDLTYLYGTDAESRDPQKRGWFFRANKSLLDRRSYDAARRHMCAIGTWDADRLLTADEKLSVSLEAIDQPLDRLSHDERFNLLLNLEQIKRTTQS